MEILPERPVGAPLETRVEQLKPRPGCLLLGIPVLAVVATFVAYAWLFYNGMIGRPATGPTVELHFAGCQDAGAVVVERVADMGLGRPEVRTHPGGFQVRVQLPTPTTDPMDLASTLATTGAFQMRDGDEVLVDSGDIASAGVRLDLGMSPSTLVVLEPEGRDRVYARMGERPDAKTSMWIDGVEVWSFGNRRPSMNGEFEIPPDAANDEERMKLAARRGIVLNHGPLPCTLTVTEARVVSRESP